MEKRIGKFHLAWRVLLVWVFLLSGLCISPVHPADANPHPVSAASLAGASPRIFLPLISRPPLPLVNAPYFDGDIPMEQTAIFWFGQVTPSSNYTDVRVGYNQTKLLISLSIIDRRLWYKPSPSINDFALWDSASVYLNINGSQNNQINNATYRFDGMLNWWEARAQYQVAYQGVNSSWKVAPLAFTTSTGWRGDAPNDNIDDRGWVINFEIPFASLGLSAPPPQGSTWSLGIVVHNRNDAAGPPNTDTKWPFEMDTMSPFTWGQLRFGLPNLYLQRVLALQERSKFAMVLMM